VSQNITLGYFIYYIYFQTNIQEATQGEGIWRLAQWGKISTGPVTIPVMPPLKTERGMVQTIAEKAEVLRARFYPQVDATLQTSNTQPSAMTLSPQTLLT
jgi:hypothetical protein